MIKLYIEDNGNKVEIKEIRSISNSDNTLIFLLKTKVSNEELEKIEKELSIKTERKCIVLDDFFEKVLEN